MLREHILSSGESYATWAARLGITPPFLSNLMNGKRLPSLALAVRIEAETGGAVPPSSWFQSADEPEVSDLGDVA